jgi:hypothetical protein
MNNRYVNEKDRMTLRWWDLLTVSLAILFFLGALGFYFYSGRASSEKEEITCVLLITEVEKRAWEERGGEWIREGDPLRNQNGTVLLGEIEAVSARPHRYAAVRENTPSWEEHPYLVDLEVTVRMRARPKEGDGLRVGDLRIAAGSTGDYRFGGYLAKAELVEVRREE